MKAQILVYLVQYILFVACKQDKVKRTQFSTGIVKLLPGTGTSTFIHEQKEQGKADRQWWVWEVILLTLLEMRALALYLCLSY